MFASSVAGRLDRHNFADRLVQANGGSWPDMEGLIRDLYVAHARPGDTMLDVGVNHGGHFIQMGEAVGEAGQVVGFEAAPELARRTMATVDLHYSHLRSRLTLHQCAVSNEPGEATFYFSKANDSGLSGLANRAILASGEVEEIKVKMHTIDSMVDDYFVALLRFAKFDIEGAEYHAFLGAKKIFDSQPIVTFEWDSSAPGYFKYQPEDLFGFIANRGYRIFDLFGYEYSNVAEFVGARVWNFVAVPLGLDPAHILSPSLDTMTKAFPDIFR